MVRVVKRASSRRGGPVTTRSCVQLPEDLAAEIDRVSKDRSTFLADAVRLALRERSEKPVAEDVARINSVVEELNREASKVLEYQVIR